MRKIILIFLLIVLFGCTTVDKKNESIPDASDILQTTNKVVEELSQYKKGDMFVLTKSTIGQTYLENMQIRKNGIDSFIDSESPDIVLYKDGKNYIYQSAISSIIPIESLEEGFVNEEIINPFLDKYIEFLKWSSTTKDVFLVKKENVVNNEKTFQVYKYTGNDNSAIKNVLRDKFDMLGDFDESDEFLVNIDYVFDDKSKLVQIVWFLDNQSGELDYFVELFFGTDIEKAYAHLGYNLDQLFNDKWLLIHQKNYSVFVDK